MKRSFSLVLVRLEGSVNLGLCARAAANFGIERLILVQPHPMASPFSEEAQAYGTHSSVILKNTEIYPSIEEALKGFDLVLGFSRRSGQYRRQDLTLKDAGGFLGGAQNIALMLGNEKNGLSDEELSKAHLSITIETSSAHPSLNLSHAAAVALHTLSQNTELCLSSASPEDIDRSAEELFSLLEEVKYFEKGGRKESLAPYLKKILRRGIREKTDAEVIINLLKRLKGMAKSKG